MRRNEPPHASHRLDKPPLIGGRPIANAGTDVPGSSWPFKLRMKKWRRFGKRRHGSSKRLLEIPVLLASVCLFAAPPHEEAQEADTKTQQADFTRFGHCHGFAGQ